MDTKTAPKPLKAINLKASDYLFSESFSFVATRGGGALGCAPTLVAPQQRREQKT